jgi:transposase InsO family protein
VAFVIDVFAREVAYPQRIRPVGLELSMVDWFNNRRLLEPIGNIPPAEAEAIYYSQSAESVEMT